MRTIKFRAKRMGFDKWLYFDMSHHLTDDSGVPPDFLQYQLDLKTVGQFTGLLDNNGKEIYEGDIIQYHYLKRYTQQSHWDVRPEIDEKIIKKASDKVVFYNGFFTLSCESVLDDDCPFITPISDFGLYSIERVKEDIFGDSLSRLSEEEQSGDCDGTDINESILGIEIIGNIHENHSLLND